ncbi:MAG TPA: hypothetical protein GX694_11255 [Actinomycetales bacterium]|nr:hypothetical protein [Actinomycetales bacterium]
MTTTRAVEQVLRCKDCGETLSVFDIGCQYGVAAVASYASREGGSVEARTDDI